MTNTLPCPHCGAEPTMRYRLMSELKVGDRIKDNDPRVSASRVLRVIEILPNGVLAEHPVSGRVFAILRRRIYTDGKPRRNGFDLIVEQP